eukprot:17100-Amphidinium_carterae.1
MALPTQTVLHHIHITTMVKRRLENWTQIQDTLLRRGRSCRGHSSAERLALTLATQAPNTTQHQTWNPNPTDASCANVMCAE